MKQHASKPLDLAVISLLKCIRNYDSISQVELSNITGYSRSTVSINCEKLLSKGFIVEDNNNSGQKKNKKLCLNKDLGYVIGIGIGGSNCRVALCDITGTVLHIETFKIDLMRGPEPTLAIICPYIDKIIEQHIDSTRPLCGIGMGIPSPVKYEKGAAFHPAFMPGWHLYPVKQFLENRYNCPSFIDNEVNTQALGEYVEMKDNSQVLLCVKIGTGIGAGIIIDRNIYRGENGGGGNIGHIQVEGVDTLCTCGKVGCIESIASVNAIEKKAAEIAKKEPHTLLKSVLEKTGEITLQDIRTAADAGDRPTLELIHEVGTQLGNLLGQLIIFLDPGKVIITGRSKLLGPVYLDYIRRATLTKSAPWTGADFQIEFSKLEEDSTATGAALLCIDELFDKQLILQTIEL